MSVVRSSAPSRREVTQPRAKIRTGIAAITGRPRETGIFIIRGHLNTAVLKNNRRRRRTGEERGDEERSLITERGAKEKPRSWNEVREGARKRGEDRWRKGVGGKGREG